MIKEINHCWIGHFRRKFSVRAITWPFALFAFLAGCSVSFEPSNVEGRVRRGVIQPNGAFQIFLLKSPNLSERDRVAVSYGDLTESCYLSSALNLDSSVELSFTCVDSTQEQRLPPIMKSTSVSQTFLWITRGKRPTHLWVNQKLFACQTDLSRSLIECDKGVAVQNITRVLN